MIKDKKIFLSPAKLNLFLKVIGRKINGYHIIRSGITFINLYDKIEIELSDVNHVVYTGPFKPINNRYEDCIIKKTLSFLNLDNKINVKISITKNIPVQGGLGSASTNAATVIKGLAAMNLLKKREPKDYSSLGADIPCFLFGKNCLIMETGEKIYSQFFPKYYFLLVKPNFNNSTKKLYEKLNFSVGFKKENILYEDIKINQEDVGNDFEKIVLKDNLDFQNIFGFMENLDSVVFVRMTGTGSCCYAAFEKKDYALKANSIFKLNFPNLWTFVCENS